MVLKVKQEEMKLQELQLQVQQEQEKLKGLKIENDLKVATTKEGVSQMLDEIIREKTGGENAEGNKS
jgi:predicted secreted Zn-dependent protease